MQLSRRSLITSQPQTPAAAAAYAAQAMAPHSKTRLIFDMHSHIEAAPPRRPDGSYDIAMDVAIRDAYLDRLGFTATVLMTRQLGDRPNGAADTRKQNDFVAWYRDNHRRRYPVALGNIDPLNGVAAGMAELRRMHEKLKLDGVIFHNVFQSTYLDDPRMIALCQEMGRRGMVCIVHLNGEGMLESSTRLGALAMAAPRTTFVGIGALGTMDNIHGMHLVGKVCPNVMFDTTACWQKGRWLTRFVKDFGSRRIVFGTDMNALPNVVYHFPQGLLDILELPELTEADRQNILWDNAQRLFPQLKALRGAL
jgi:predicted TIM-barrel fold metal-dependent hydrolase